MTKLEQIATDGTPLLIDTQRVRTISYGWPRRPFMTEYLGADREDLIVAAHAAVQGQELTSELVQQLGQDYLKVVSALNLAEERANVTEQQLVAHQGITAGLQLKLEGVVFTLDMTEGLYETELAERIRIAALHAEVSEHAAWLTRQVARLSLQNLHLRHELAGTTPVSVEIACRDDETTVVDVCHE